MAITISSGTAKPNDRSIQQKPLSFEEFLVHYGGDNRYELIDGEVFDLEPTVSQVEVAALITTKICVQIDAIGLPWFVLQRGKYYALPILP